MDIPPDSPASDRHGPIITQAAKLAAGAPPSPRAPEQAQAAADFRALRKALGLNVPELAALIRANPRTIHGWEGGKASPDPTAWLLLQTLARFPAVRKWAAAGLPSKPPRKVSRLSPAHP